MVLKWRNSIVCLSNLSFKGAFVLVKIIDSNCCVLNQSSFSMTLVVAMEFAILSIMPTNQNENTHLNLITSSILGFSKLSLNMDNFVTCFPNLPSRFQNFGH